MTCQECGELIAEYLEGTLRESGRRDVEAHGQNCGACRGEMEEARRLAERVRSLPRHEPGAEVVLRISEKIRDACPAPRRTEFGPVMDIADLAEFLRVDRETIGLYLDEIPCFELGGKLLFRRARVEQWIEDREMTLGVQSDRLAHGELSLSGRSTRGGVVWTLSGKN